MDNELKNSYIANYVEEFRKNPERFAVILSQDEIKSYGISNNAFWKHFIVNFENLDTKQMFSNEDIYKNLAKIYFIKKDNEKLYMVEKLPNIKPNLETVNELAKDLKKQGIEVDLESAVLFNKATNQIKFRKYKSIKE